MQRLYPSSWVHFVSRGSGYRFNLSWTPLDSTQTQVLFRAASGVILHKHRLQKKGQKMLEFRPRGYRSRQVVRLHKPLILWENHFLIRFSCFSFKYVYLHENTCFGKAGTPLTNMFFRIKYFNEYYKNNSSVLSLNINLKHNKATERRSLKRIKIEIRFFIVILIYFLLNSS